jgi:hypothetical protein
MIFILSSVIGNNHIEAKVIFSGMYSFFHADI